MTEKLSAEILDRFQDVERNYEEITGNIAKAALRSGRKPEDIILLAATKTVEPVIINHAVSLGLSYIGENKVQELLSKYEDYDLTIDEVEDNINYLLTNLYDYCDNTGIWIEL